MSKGMSRREAIRSLALGTLGAALGLSARAPAAERRPNFLFILTDDQRWDAMSNMPNRFSFLRTPNMDRLAREGARFENAFVTISLCSPSRACFLTGRYAHSNGVRVNERNDFYPGLPTYASLLQQAGWSTAFLGKWHMRPDPSPRPGFDYWLSFRGQGTYNNPVLNENGRNFQAQGYITDLLTDYAERWLRRQDGPFCLVLSHKAIHGPFTPAPRHAHAFPDAQIPPPPSYNDNLRDKPAWMRRAAVYGARAEKWRQSEGKPIPEELGPMGWDPHAQGRLNYFRTLLAVDESVGRMLQTLEDLGRLDDTVVIYTSDNGYFIGEHRRGDKRLAYEESIRIPLLLRYPRLVRAGSRPGQMVLNLDLAPTILDLAGVEIPREMQGRSLRPVLSGEAKNWRQSWMYEYFREAWLPGVPTMLAVRSERWKYITYPDLDDLDELYDLEKDPHEMTNLAVKPDYRDQLEAMRRELEELRKQTGYDKAPQAFLPKMQVKPEAVLVMNFDEDSGGQVRDSSGKGNDGQVSHAPLVEGRGGQGKARRFDGHGVILVPRSPSLNPGIKPITVSAVVKPDKPKGVIVARGGESHGFALYLTDGKPAFAVRSSGEMFLVVAPRKIPEGWVELTAMLTHDLRMVLYVDGKKVAEEKADWFIPTDPNEGLNIGADRDTRVGPYGADNGFVGLIDEVRIYTGEKPPRSSS